MFKNRSSKKELLDADNIPENLLFQNLRELEFINKYLGGHRISRIGIKKLITQKKKIKHIADIGCGGGDSLIALAEMVRRENLNYSFTGLDLKKECIDYTISHCNKYPEISAGQMDFRDAFQSIPKIDLVHASLFCHHFSEEELIGFIKLCSMHHAIFLINDLERNPIAYFSIKLLTMIFSKSPLVKNDAPLSVLRGFKKIEWQKIIESAGIKNYSIQNYWAFRHLVIIYPNE